MTTDLSENLQLYIEPYLLKSDEYYNDIIIKKNIVLHHTAGWDNPYNTINDWNNDTRGKIGTEFVIGGINPKTNESKYNGRVIRAIPEKRWAWHLGGSEFNISEQMNKESIGIELCNFGALTERNNKYYNYINSEINSKYVIKLSKAFRGYIFWHAYTQKQLDKLKQLLIELKNKYSIDVSKGLKQLLTSSYNEYDAFEFKLNDIKRDSAGIWSHGNFRKDKFDVYPHPELINILKYL